MQQNVLDAIREGNWDFEPALEGDGVFSSTAAIPGSPEKIDILAARAELGLPLWHDQDRQDYEDWRREQRA
jgi:hypothetical protein